MSEPEREWPLFEVFIRARSGLEHKHVGSIHAVDARMAIEHARDVYTRRQEGVSIWVVPSAAIVASDPQDAEAVASAARLISALEGPECVREFLLERVERFPHNVELLQAAAEHLREDAPAEAERLVRRLIEFNPVDGWARRELAIDLDSQERQEETLVELAAAESLEPHNPFVFSIRGRILERMARMGEAAGRGSSAGYRIESHSPPSWRIGERRVIPSPT